MFSAPGSAATPHRRRSVVLLGVLLLGMLASLPFTVQDFWDARPDAARYLLAARSLAAGEGYTVMGEPFRLRPPGFSALLAPVVAWRGFDFATLDLFVSLFGVLAVLLLYLLLLPRVGAYLAFAVGLLTWLNPQLQALCNQVLSDVPALAFVLGALLILRWANARPSTARDAVLALAIAAAVYVRSANLLLLPAFALDRFCRWALTRSSSAPREPLGRFVALRIALPSVLFLVLYLPWLLTPSFSSQYDSPDLHSYSTAFLRSDPNDPDAAALGAQQWSARFADNATAYAAMFTSGMTSRRPSALAPLVAGLGAIALLVALSRRREAPEWLAVGTLVVLVGYYVAAQRLLLPVFVLTVAALVDGALWLGDRVAGRRVAECVIVGCLALLAILSSNSNAQRADARARSESLLAAAQHVRQTVPPDAAIGGDVGAVYALLLDRPVYSLRPLGRRGKHEELLRLLDERKIAVLIAQRPGALDDVVREVAASGDEVVTLPHHVVVHLSPAVH